ncbi:MAG: hypothetical protein JWM11_5688 [Planctomycetaceae bacterium]|nr:hypothetical protein [Planctomycetaceae bacterium]
MVNSILRNCIKALGLSGPSVKRTHRAQSRWTTASELLEERQMLSAVSLDAPVTAEVAHAKTPFQAPNVAGTWDVAISGQQSATATVTQAGSKVTVSYDFPVIGHVELTGHFTKHNSHSFSGKTTLNLPNVGKVKVAYSIEFPEVASPTTFTAEATLTSKSLPQPLQFNLTGTKQQALSANNLDGIGRAAMFPTIIPSWTVTATESGTQLDGDLTFSQTGKSGKHVTGVIHFGGQTVNISGNLKNNSTDLKGSAKSVAEPGLPSERGSFDIVFFDSFTTFTGSATFKKLHLVVALDGAAVLTM